MKVGDKVEVLNKIECMSLYEKGEAININVGTKGTVEDFVDFFGNIFPAVRFDGIESVERLIAVHPKNIKVL